MAEFRISILHVHFGQNQKFFKVLKTDFTIQYFQYRVGTLFAIHRSNLETIFFRIFRLGWLCLLPSNVTE